MEPAKLGAASAGIDLFRRPSPPKCRFAIGNARTSPGIQVNFAFSPVGLFQKKIVASHCHRRRSSTALTRPNGLIGGRRISPACPFARFPGFIQRSFQWASHITLLFFQGTENSLLRNGAGATNCCDHVLHKSRFNRLISSLISSQKYGLKFRRGN